MTQRGWSWLWAALMALTALAGVGLKPRLDPGVQVRAAVPLESLFPLGFGGWALDPSAVAPVRPAFDVARRFQMYDQVLERTYVNAQGQRIMLSVAYGRQQSVGLQMHRPEVCYKAGGFKVEGLHDVTLPVMGRALPITRLLAHMEGRPEPITYWRLLGDELVQGESTFRLQAWSWSDRALMDGLLVRVSSIDPDHPAAWQTHARFILDLAQAMTPAQRMRVFGAGS